MNDVLIYVNRHALLRLTVNVGSALKLEEILRRLWWKKVEKVINRGLKNAPSGQP